MLTASPKSGLRFRGLYGPDPHVVRAGRLRWNEGKCGLERTRVYGNIHRQTEARGPRHASVR